MNVAHCGHCRQLWLPLIHLLLPVFLIYYRGLFAICIDIISALMDSTIASVAGFSHPFIFIESLRVIEYSIFILVLVQTFPGSGYLLNIT